MTTLQKVYSFLISLAVIASSYSLFRPGIAKPSYPDSLTSALLAKGFDLPLIASEEKNLEKDSTDRKISNLHHYKFADGSELLSLIVRLRKKDDFKIEGYGQLTKGFDPIYMESPVFSNRIPYSMVGLIKGNKYYQTCLIPGSRRLEQVDVRLYPLVALAESFVVRKRDLVSKVFGTVDKTDYSCMVLTFKLAPKKDEFSNTQTWISIINNIQKTLSN